MYIYTHILCDQSTKFGIRNCTTYACVYKKHFYSCVIHYQTFIETSFLRKTQKAIYVKTVNMKRLGFPQVRYYTLVHLSHSSNRVFKDWQQGCWTCISNWETKTQKISQEYAELLLSNRDWMETHCLRTGDWGRDTRLEK